MIETSDEEEEGETVAVSETQSKLVTPVMKVEPQKQKRKPKASMNKEPATSPKSNAQSGHLDSDFQSNAMMKPGPSTLKLPLEPKPDDDVRIVLICGLAY
jgi:hypothetical protein